MKKEIELQNSFYPWELVQAIEDFVVYYSHRRYQESLDNQTLVHANSEELMK